MAQSAAVACLGRPPCDGSIGRTLRSLNAASSGRDVAPDHPIVRTTMVARPPRPRLLTRRAVRSPSPQPATPRHRGATWLRAPPRDGRRDRLGALDEHVGAWRGPARSGSDGDRGPDEHDCGDDHRGDADDEVDRLRKSQLGVRTVPYRRTGRPLGAVRAGRRSVFQLCHGGVASSRRVTRWKRSRCGRRWVG